MTTATVKQRVFEYTDEWDVDSDFSSTSVERLLVNRNGNTGEVAVEWKESDHETYVFTGVPRGVLDTLLDGSVGSNVAKVKSLYGPAERFDKCWQLDQKLVPLKASPGASTSNVSLSAPTPSYSLQTPPVAPVVDRNSGLTAVSKDYTYRLFWEFEGVERETVLSTDVKTLDEALNRLDSQAKALGLEIKVTKAVIEFV